MRSYRRKAIGFYTKQGKVRPITKRKRYLVKPRKMQYKIERVEPEEEEIQKEEEMPKEKLEEEKVKEEIKETPMPKIEKTKPIQEKQIPEKTTVMPHEIHTQNIKAEEKKIEPIKESISGNKE
jgi:hypothetical protein